MSSTSKILKQEKFLRVPLSAQRNFAELSAWDRSGENAASHSPSFLNCGSNSCSATPMVLALMKRLQVSVTSSGTQTASLANAKRMSCLVDSWSFLKQSFSFLSSQP